MVARNSCHAASFQLPTIVLLHCYWPVSAMQCPDGGSNEIQETSRNGTLTKSKDSKIKICSLASQKPRRRHEKKGRGSGSEEANSRGAVLSLLESTTPRSVHSLAREWGVLRNISRRINLLFSHRPTIIMSKHLCSTHANALRRGKWTPEEEEFAKYTISVFQSGV